MKKKALLLVSMGVLACTVGVTALVVGGANQLDAFPVKADPTGYEITFNESNTTVEAVGDHYAIYTTTPRGAKVGVVGSTNFDASSSFTFKGTHFRSLRLFDSDDSVLTERAYEFSHITGFAISYSGGLGVAYDDDGTGKLIASGEEYKGLSITPTPDVCPMFYAGGSVTISSLTIWYSC